MERGSAGIGWRLITVTHTGGIYKTYRVYEKAKTYPPVITFDDPLGSRTGGRGGWGVWYLCISYMGRHQTPPLALVASVLPNPILSTADPLRSQQL